MDRSVLVVGAQGVLGSLLARRFTAAGWEVTRAGRRPEEAEDFRLLDLADRAAAEAVAEEAGLIVNMAHHPALHLERAVLRDGGMLIELCDLTAGERAVLQEADGVGDGLIVTDAGLSGVAYLAIAELLFRHQQADAAHYALMFSAAGSSGPAGALLGHRLLGSARHHAARQIPLPRPWGTQQALEIQSADVLRPSVAGIPVRHSLAMQPRSLRALLAAFNAARLISFLPAAAFSAGAGKVPDEPSREPICEWVAVSHQGETLAARTIRGEGYYRMTADAILAFAEILAARPQPEHGLLALDELIALPEVAGTLKRRGISVSGGTSFSS